MFNDSTTRPAGIRPTPLALNLRRELPSACYLNRPDGTTCDFVFKDITTDSRNVQSDGLFVAITGTRNDGHHFVHQAVRNGAAAVLVERPVENLPVSQCVVRDTRAAFSQLSAARWGNPSKKLKTVGVTGTNGKTTTTWILRSIFQAASYQSGILGTIEYSDGIEKQESSLTTPGPDQSHEWLARMVEVGTTHLPMEVSSHALDQNRVNGIEFDVAVVTNITQDHFDYHGGLEHYQHSKQKIFQHLKPDGLAVLNTDDRTVWSFRELLPSNRTVGFCLTSNSRPEAPFSARILEESLSSTVFELRLPSAMLEVQSPLIGRHNVYNCLAAATAACHLGLTPAEISRGIANLKAVPGRMEAIECGQKFSVLVDYAHTEDALRRAIQSLKGMTPGHVIVVYGAGGDRDRSKRAGMTQAALLADRTILTSDNPRSEEPQRIINDCLAGCLNVSRIPIVITDRAEAIHFALEIANPGDCVLIAGKGHETEQIIGTQRHYFDDREIARLGLASFPNQPHFGKRPLSVKLPLRHR